MLYPGYIFWIFPFPPIQCIISPLPHPLEESVMSKGMDQKKSEKKKPAKTLLEKRAAKTEKKKSKSH